DEINLGVAAKPLLVVETAGKHAPHAAHLLMKLLHPARVYRYDLLKITTTLASAFKRWSIGCDTALRRLFQNVKVTLEQEAIGWVEVSPTNLKLCAFSDADWRGCKMTLRSTTGVFVCIEDEHTFFPLAAVSRRQTTVATSTGEAEITAASATVRLWGAPLAHLLHAVPPAY
ncbi:MAG: hypothetical protein AAGF76_06360, partial [Pseudomonadota bacterium]